MEQRTVMLGDSAVMRDLEQDIERAAGCHAKVLITGESGVGKELVARRIHDEGRRRSAAFVAINCAGVPDTLLESELFGHVRGSFTGAFRDKRGWLEAAHTGTAFLDEVGEMSVRMQGMLLRFLELGEIQRVGADKPLPPLNVRVIAATHRDLWAKVGDKSFREDLYYRMNVIHIKVPPLRERVQDIPFLLKHFLETFSTAYEVPVPDLSTDVMHRLLTHHWPGNVRELKNAAERLVVSGGDGRSAMRSLFPGAVFEPAPAPAPPRGAGDPLRREMIERLVTEGLSFWSDVHEPFMKRDLTRDDIRELVQAGLAHTGGNYKSLVRVLNMPPADYKRFLNFLRAHECHVAYRAFRSADATGLSAPVACA